MTMEADICTYCGRRVEWFCRQCGEAHLMTAQEYFEYHGFRAEDDEGEDE